MGINLQLTDLLNEDDQSNPVKAANLEGKINQMVDFWKEGMPPGKETGIPDLNPHFRWMPGFTYCFTGYDNSGKSAILKWLAVLYVLEYGKKVCIYDPETEIEETWDELARMYLGKNTTTKTMEPKYPRCSLEEYMVGLSWVKDNFVLLENDKLPTIDHVYERFNKEVQMGVGMCILDPFNWVTLPGGKGPDSLEEELSKMVLWAKENQVISIYVEHPKTPQNIKDGVIPRCSKYTVMNGTTHAKKVHCFVAIHKEKDTDNKWVNIFDVQKMKSQRRMGTPGMVNLRYEVHTGRFYGEAPF